MFETARPYDPFNTGTPTTIVVEIDGVQTYIPMDPANTDYQAYLAWLAEGNVPLPPDTEQG